MYVPTRPEEVLSGAAPTLGNAHDAYAAAAALRRLETACGGYRAALQGAQRHLRQNQGVAVAKLSGSLARHARGGVEALQSDATAGESSFVEYGRQLERLSMQAHAIERETVGQLDQIRSCAAQLSELSGECGAGFPTVAWNEVPRYPPVLLLERIGSESAPLAALRQHVEDDWPRVAARWQMALDEVDALRRRWAELSEQRIDAERRLVACLCARSPEKWLGPVEQGGASDAFSVVRPASGPTLGVAGVPVPGRHHALLDELYRTHATTVALYGSPSAAQVETWWRALSLEDRERLIDNASLAIGNLDGVPLDQRVRANAVTARYTSGYAAYSAEQRAYLRNVASGKARLVVYDPAGSRLVEMIGTPSLRTERVLTYLPGTGSLPKHFYSGDAQQVAEYLVRESGGTTVAFVYKDGPWISWAGSHANTNYEFEAQIGMEVASFQRDVIDREPTLATASRVAAAHSAGLSALSGAELAGAHFDTVLSLSGAFVLPGWAPDPATEYHHFQYDNDAINVIDGGRSRTPHELDGVFAPHIFDSAQQGRVESHSRIDDGPETNSGPLEAMLQALENQGKE